MMFWIWLNTIPKIGPITGNLLLEHFQTPETIYEASYEELIAVKGMTNYRVQSILQNHSLDKAQKIYEECQRKGIVILTKEDPRYPEKAKILYDAPTILYCRGNIKPLGKSVAIVGPRRCTQDEKQNVVTLASTLVDENYSIVSGMAKGIDSYAHTICLKKGGYTVAVLGCGVDYCYPKEHQPLMNAIIEQGLVISEYPPGTRPKQYHFPRRNRIISAWSDCVYTIGERRKSGSDITVEFAESYGRLVNREYDATLSME